MNPLPVFEVAPRSHTTPRNIITGHDATKGA